MRRRSTSAAPRSWRAGAKRHRCCHACAARALDRRDPERRPPRLAHRRPRPRSAPRAAHRAPQRERLAGRCASRTPAAVTVTRASCSRPTVAWPGRPTPRAPPRGPRRHAGPDNSQPRPPRSMRSAGRRGTMQLVSRPASSRSRSRSRRRRPDAATPPRDRRSRSSAMCVSVRSWSPATWRSSAASRPRCSASATPAPDERSPPCAGRRARRITSTTPPPTRSRAWRSQAASCSPSAGAPRARAPRVACARSRSRLREAACSQPPPASSRPLVTRRCRSPPGLMPEQVATEPGRGARRRRPGRLARLGVAPGQAAVDASTPTASAPSTHKTANGADRRPRPRRQHPRLDGRRRAPAGAAHARPPTAPPRESSNHSPPPPPPSPPPP